MDAFANAGYGDLSVGFGAKPGIVVVDFQMYFTDPQYPTGDRPLIKRALKNTARLLAEAREYGIPVANCNTSYLNSREMPYWKIGPVYDTHLHHHPSTQYDPSIFDADYDLAVCKKAPSIFFGTDVSSYFTKERVDTVIVTGCNTSGCIRATAVDSFSHRYRTIVPEDCVGDLEEQPHRDNLRDIGRRYCDVSDVETVLDQIRAWHRAQ
jgi:maleamate amidohydrolase